MMGSTEFELQNSKPKNSLKNVSALDFEGNVAFFSKNPLWCPLLVWENNLTAPCYWEVATPSLTRMIRHKQTLSFDQDHFSTPQPNHVVSSSSRRFVVGAGLFLLCIAGKKTGRKQRKKTKKHMKIKPPLH